MSEENKILNIKPTLKYFIIQDAIVKSLKMTMGIFSIFWFILFSAIGVAYGFFAALIISLFISFFIIFIRVLWLYFVYKKTRYEIHPDKIVQISGNLFADARQELLFKNVTALSQINPLFMRPFKQGEIIIDSAGAITDTINILGIPNPEKLFGILVTDLQRNGYKLNKSDIVARTYTSKAQIFLMSTLYPMLSIIVVSTILLSMLFDDTPGAMILIWFFGLVSIIVGAVLKVLDYRSRVYTIYDDSVEYYEGFLTKVRTTLPMEKISDSKRIQSLWGRIIQFSTFHISTIGSGRDIDFSYIPKAKELSHTLNSQLELFRSNTKNETHKLNTETLETKNEDHKITDQEISKELKSDASRQEDIFDRNDFTANFKADFVRSSISWFILLPFCLLFFPFFIVWLFGFIAISIKKLFTIYRVEKGHFAEDFKFISVVEKKANIDKITTVIVKRSIFDRLFGICTIKIISLGTADNIMCNSIKYDPALINEIRRKVGLDFNDELKTEQLRFSAVQMMKKYFVGYFIVLPIILIISTLTMLFLAFDGETIFFIFLILIYLLIFGTIIFGYITEKLSYDNKKFAFYRKGVSTKLGFWIKSESFARYNNIKGIRTIKYPGSKNGDLILDIAGEDLVQEQNSSNGQNRMVPRSVKITIPYYPDIIIADEILDFIMLYINKNFEYPELVSMAKEYTPEIYRNSKPSYLPTTLIHILFMVLIPFLIPLLLVTLFLSILKLYFTTYQMESIRVLTKSGIIYKSQHSIIHSRIDFIGKHQGLMGKITSTGRVEINTVGGSVTEMSLNSLRQFEEFYKTLSEKYGLTKEK